MNTKKTTFTLRTLVGAVLAGGALIGAASASAQQAEPYALRADAVQSGYGDAHLMPVGVQLSIGWHDNRYWDGHRYWERDEWMRHHPHDHGPDHFRHDDHRDDHRDHY